MRVMRKRFLQIFFLIGGIVLMMLGIFRAELIEIMKKGITVCFECIGIG